MRRCFLRQLRRSYDSKKKQHGRWHLAFRKLLGGMAGSARQASLATLYAHVRVRMKGQLAMRSITGGLSLYCYYDLITI